MLRYLRFSRVPCNFPLKKNSPSFLVFLLYIVSCQKYFPSIKARNVCKDNPFKESFSSSLWLPEDTGNNVRDTRNITHSLIIVEYIFSVIITQYIYSKIMSFSLPILLIDIIKNISFPKKLEIFAKTISFKEILFLIIFIGREELYINSIIIKYIFLMTIIQNIFSNYITKLRLIILTIIHTKLLLMFLTFYEC